MNEIIPFKELILSQESNFNELANDHNAVSFKRECEFALQILQGNDFTAKMANQNPKALENCIKQVASVGVSLNPAKNHSYLVPMDGKVNLVISYRGLVNLAITSKSVKFVVSTIVREEDKFTFNGLGKEPTHTFDVFSTNRGKIVGAYCVAKTFDNEYLTEVMNIEEIYKIRSRSKSFAGGKSSPWKSDEEEMIKKTVIKRAAKLWPMFDKQTDRLVEAIEVVNSTEGTDFNKDLSGPASEEKIERIQKLLVLMGREEIAYLVHVEKREKRRLESLEDFTSAEADRAIAELDSFVGGAK